MHYTIDDKKKFLKDNLSAKRFHHSVNVAEECRKLAQKYGEDPERAYFAGLLHDICKELPGEEQKDLVLKSGFSVFRHDRDHVEVDAASGQLVEHAGIERHVLGQAAQVDFDLLGQGHAGDDGLFEPFGQFFHDLCPSFIGKS